MVGHKAFYFCIFVSKEMAMPQASISIKKNFSFEDYLELEEKENLRHEFLNGLVLTKLGESFTHHNICQNIACALEDKLDRDVYHCFLFSLKTEALKDKYYFYPDIVLTSREEDMASEYIIKNPLLVAEVLSPSTESYSRNEKWNAYRRIPSLKYFLFVNQEKPLVELFSRSQPNELYTYQAFDNIEDIIQFTDLQFSMSLKQIYENIHLPENSSHL